MMNFGKPPVIVLPETAIQAAPAEVQKRLVFTATHNPFLRHNQSDWRRFSVGFRYEDEKLTKSLKEAFSALTGYNGDFSESYCIEYGDFKIWLPYSDKYGNSRLTLISLETDRLKNEGCGWNQLISQFEAIAIANNKQFVYEDENEMGYK
jgi:hypothetical protein